MILPRDELSKYQRNDVFRAIERSKSPVTEFELTSTAVDRYGQRYPVAIISHLTSGSVFCIVKLAERRVELTGRRSEQFEMRHYVGHEAASIKDIFTRQPRDDQIVLWEGVPPIVTEWARYSSQ